MLENDRFYVPATSPEQEVEKEVELGVSEFGLGVSELGLGVRAHSSKLEHL